MAVVLSHESLCSLFGHVPDRSGIADGPPRFLGFGDSPTIFERLRPQPVEAFDEIF